LADLESNGNVTLQHLTNLESSGNVTLQHLTNLESSGNVTLQHLVESNGDVTLQHLVESISNAIVPEIKNELHLMEKSFMEATKQEIQSMESKLHSMLKMELDNMISLLVQLQQQQVPCNVYFTTTCSSHQRQLIVKMVPKIQVVHLHLLCKYIEGIHVVKNQKGEEITLIDPKMRKWVPYLVTSLTIFSLLLKVGGPRCCRNR